MELFTSNSDQITRNYLDSLLLETRYLDAVLPDSGMELYGEHFDTPVMTAALSHLGNTAPNGMEIYAQGAQMAGAVHWIGMGDDEELERIVATGARTIKIVKPMADHAEVLRELKHAEDIGCFAVGMDIDHAFSGSGDYDNVLGIPMKAKTSEEMKEYVSSAKIPFIVKGVMSAQDARKCVEFGAAGIQVSHHHGIMNYSLPPLMALPAILEAVEGKIPVFVDCGFESGMDVYKALALGAKAVSVGRHLMPYLKDGAQAVAGRIREMDAELRGVMARTGVGSLQEMDPTVIHRTMYP
ncbi:MAG: alpha-hydroxy-acid oxidizing protein [Lachnospiraceae bacterium]|nr:alpha-hydroxy-acid oxidizing protein [Lachnospiraceae bacterium]